MTYFSEFDQFTERKFEVYTGTFSTQDGRRYINEHMNVKNETK